MIHSLTIAIVCIVGLMVAWSFIQFLWKGLFHEEVSDPDALAGRSSCGDCGCGLICQKKKESNHQKSRTSPEQKFRIGPKY